MSEKRRDNKGRVLLSCERQRADGMYEFRYVNAQGEKRSVYSWKLVATDKVPPGKRCKEPLRDIERRVMRDLEDGIDTIEAYRTTLNYLFDDYIETKYELKQSTRTNYKYMYKKYVHDDLGTRKIASIKYSDIKKFYIHLIKDVGFKPNSLETIHTILHPVFATAVRDNIIRINPSDGVMAEIKRHHDWVTPKRHALTVAQQEAFVTFCSNSKQYAHWMPLFTVLLGTGCRVGEVIGLRWEDCDFEQNLISVNHNLIYRQQDNGACELHITTPKTRAGTRVIPMFREVREALMQEHTRQQVTGFNQTKVDGYSGFIFSNRFGNVILPVNINQAIERIVRDYNRQETEEANKGQREPILIPHFTVHQLRHTFCTRFCENERDIKVIQEIMGHADISTTMDIYNEATIDRKKQSFANLEGKVKIV